MNTERKMKPIVRQLAKDLDTIVDQNVADIVKDINDIKRDELKTLKVMKAISFALYDLETNKIDCKQCSIELAKIRCGLESNKICTGFNTLGHLAQLCRALKNN